MQDADESKRRRTGIVVAVVLVTIVLGLAAWTARDAANRAAETARQQAETARASATATSLVVRLVRASPDGPTIVRLGGSEAGPVGEVATMQRVADAAASCAKAAHDAGRAPACRIDADTTVPTPEIVAVAQKLVASGIPEVKFDASGR